MYLMTTTTKFWNGHHQLHNLWTPLITISLSPSLPNSTKFQSLAKEGEKSSGRCLVHLFSPKNCQFSILDGQALRPFVTRTHLLLLPLLLLLPVFSFPAFSLTRKSGSQIILRLREDTRTTTEIEGGNPCPHISIDLLFGHSFAHVFYSSSCHTT